MNKQKLLSGLIKYQIIEIVLNVLFLLFFMSSVFYGAIRETPLVDFFDFSIFSSFIGIALINIFSRVIEKYIASKLEDSVKLTTEYKKLIKSYTVPEADSEAMQRTTADGEINKLITWDGADHSKKRLVLPEIYVCNLYHCPVRILDSQNKYQLPEEIEAHFDEIMEAYKTSIIYNQLNIRVDNWHLDEENHNFVIRTSRTEYFKSLATNRAMDYRWKNGLTVRSVLDYGPFMHSLEESQLSNHLGFNGFIESSDKMIMFVKRGAHLSIGKNMYGTSVGASLKSKYGLTNGVFTKEGLKKAICMEIEDECKIHVNMEKFILENHLIAAYRDMVEGGKPQLLFFLHIDHMTRNDIEKNFQARVKTVKNKKTSVIEDGFRFLWLTREEIQKVELGDDYMLHNNKKYPMTPSTVASIVLLQNHFRELEKSNGDC